MSTSPQNNSIETIEAQWKAEEARIHMAEAEKLAKMSPQEKTEYMAAQKQKFQEEKQKVKAELGYGSVKPLTADEKRELEAKEEQKKLEELEAFERKQGKKEGGEKSTLERKDKLPEVDLKKFKEFFVAAEENIEKHKPFQFESLSVNDLGKHSRHHAFMSGLIDHSQKEVIKPSEIWKRLEEKKADPWQIGLKVDIDMGEDKNNKGLVNLSFEMPLASLLDGHFMEKLTHFTNLVFFAAELHYRKNKNEIAKLPETDHEKEKSPGKVDQKSTDAAKPFGLTAIGTDGGLQSGASLFENSSTTGVAFSFNNGSIWGTFDAMQAPTDEKKLQEALDKITTEK